MNKEQYITEIEVLHNKIVERTAAACKLEAIFGSDDPIAEKCWEEVGRLKKQKEHAQRMSQLHPKTRGKIEKELAGM